MDDGLKSQGPTADVRLGLSALLDGEHERHELEKVCQAWRDDAGVRQSWHAYSLIGDVLRSEDLARDAGGDAAFLARLRSRMADEPVVLAPQGMVSTDADRLAATRTGPVGQAVRLHAAAAAPAPAARRSWGAPLAMAAGVVTVVGVAVMMRGLPGPAAQGPLVATAASGAVAVATRGNGATGADDAATVVRNPDLDRYLNAHRQYGGAGVIGTPGGFRQVATSPADR